VSVGVARLVGADPAGHLAGHGAGPQCADAAASDQPQGPPQHAPVDAGDLRRRVVSAVDDELPGHGDRAFDDAAVLGQGRADGGGERAHDGVSTPSIRGKALNWICTGREPGLLRRRYLSMKAMVVFSYSAAISASCSLVRCRLLVSLAEASTHSSGIRFSS